MTDLILGVIALCLVVLTIELTIVMYFIMIFLNEAIALTRRIKALEISLEEKMNKLETGLTILGVGMFKRMFRGFGKFFKTNNKKK